jgi:hypothetical protein
VLDGDAANVIEMERPLYLALAGGRHSNRSLTPVVFSRLSHNHNPNTNPMPRTLPRVKRHLWPRYARNTAVVTAS